MSLTREDEDALRPRMAPLHATDDERRPLDESGLEFEPDDDDEPDDDGLARRVAPDEGPTIRDRVLELLRRSGGRIDRSDGMITHHVAAALMISNEQARNALGDLSQRREIWRDTRGGKRTYAIGLGPGPAKLTVTRTNFAPAPLIGIGETEPLHERAIAEALPDLTVDAAQARLILSVRYLDLLLMRFTVEPAEEIADRIERMLATLGDET